MHPLDYSIFALYMLAILGVGYYHYRRNRSGEDYYVGGRNVPPFAVGLSIVATDVGGGFSIGLGGVGFLMGLSGTWLLFTGLVGAWFTAVFLIPRIKRVDAKLGMMTYPDFLRHRYGPRVAFLAAILSAIGYLLFTGSQIRAGATLASETVFRTAPFGWDTFTFSLYAMAAIIIAYTVLGGIKAVIFTDVVQWLVLLFGLLGLALPLALHELGGWQAFREAMPAGFFSLRNLSAATFVNWMVTILPIWVVGMTLYQRMYACKGVREGRRAWFIAGLFEYPVMAFTGVLLGMCARALYPELDAAQAELGLPRLINDVLPVGISGIVAAAYFSAIMSTADSCLMASSGNLVGDLLQRHGLRRLSERQSIRLSQGVTLLVGLLAIAHAQRFGSVIEGVFDAYGFLVAGLFVPTLGAFFWPRGTSAGAFAGMLTGGILVQILPRLEGRLPASLGSVVHGSGLSPVVFGILASAAVFVTVSLLTQPQAVIPEPPREDAP